jgi:hypothetical protein
MLNNPCPPLTKGLRGLALLVGCSVALQASPAPLSAPAARSTACIRKYRNDDRSPRVSICTDAAPNCSAVAPLSEAARATTCSAGVCRPGLSRPETAACTLHPAADDPH